MGGLFCFNFLNDKVNSEHFTPIAYNGFGLGEGGIVGCSNLAVIVCPLLPNTCYVVVFFFIFFAVGIFLD